MIRGLFRLLSQLVALIILGFALTAVYIVYDGLNDKGDTADCAVVLGHAVKAGGQPGAILQERLDRAVKLYNVKKVPLIIVSGGLESGSVDESVAMASYLEAQGVPAGAVIKDPNGAHTSDTAHSVAKIMHERHLHSVMIVSHYYHITRTKVALEHEGIHEISQAHVGTVVKQDMFTIAREVGALWYYIFQEYVKPEATQATIQAADEAQKLKAQIQSDTGKAKDDVEKNAKDK
jgi:vancomycin permeability regulator SanA